MINLQNAAISAFNRLPTKPVKIPSHGPPRLTPRKTVTPSRSRKKQTPIIIDLTLDDDSPPVRKVKPAAAPPPAPIVISDSEEEERDMDELEDMLMSSDDESDSATSADYALTVFS